MAKTLTERGQRSRRYKHSPDAFDVKSDSKARYEERRRAAKPLIVETRTTGQRSAVDAAHEAAYVAAHAAAAARTQAAAEALGEKTAEQFAQAYAAAEILAAKTARASKSGRDKAGIIGATLAGVGLAIGVAAAVFIR